MLYSCFLAFLLPILICRRDSDEAAPSCHPERKSNFRACTKARGGTPKRDLRRGDRSQRPWRCPPFGRVRLRKRRTAAFSPLRMTRWNDASINPNLFFLFHGKTKINVVLGGGTKTTAGAIERGSAQINNYFYPFLGKYLGGVGELLSRSPPQKYISFQISTMLCAAERIPIFPLS